MRFNLEPGDTFCDGKSKLVNVKINDEERINLPYTSYIFDKHHHFIISNFRLSPMESTLTNSFKRLQLKLEKIGGNYKLALVNDLDQYYYYVYYNGTNTVKIATFNSIPSNSIKYQDQHYILSYAGECLVNFVPLINSRVLVDPKDIMSNKDIDFVLKELENLPDKRLRIGVGENFLKGPEEVLSSTYKSAEVYGIRGNKIGILNNIATSFSNKKLKLFSGTVSIDTIDQFGANLGLKKTNPRFRIKRLNNDNYVGCILSRYGKCERFYALTPESFEQEEHTYTDYDDEEEFDQQSHYLYPYYYYLHGLKVSMNHRKIEELEQKIKDLEKRIGNLPLNTKSADGVTLRIDEVVAKFSSDTNYLNLLAAAIMTKEQKNLTEFSRSIAHYFGEIVKRDNSLKTLVEGKPGPIGFPGLRGSPGEKGERGYSGLKGDKGVQGLSIIGEKGDPGEMGLKGFKGDIGPSGLRGQSGAKGDKGNSGFQGSKGERGWKGEPGSKGLQGLKGDSGIKGETGPNGNKGDAGPQGIDGASGLDGVPGISGLKGDKGNIGPEGKKGELGMDGMPGVHGPKGEKGNVGPIGPQGLQGSKGHVGRSGSKGVDGVPGLIGIPGSKGDMGSQGLQGEKGDQGIAGQKGERGNNGTDANPEEVAQKLINNGTIVKHVLEYRNQEGDLVLEQQIAGKLIYDQNIHAGIATELIDNKAQELADALLSDANDTLVAKLANSTELTQSISEGLRQNPGETKGDQGVQGLKGIDGASGGKGEKGNTGPVGPKGADGLPGMPGPVGLKGDKGDIGLQGSEGQVSVLKGSKGDTGQVGMPGSKGEDGIGADMASQFLCTINQTRTEIRDARQAVEVAKNTSEGFAKKAQDAERNVTRLHDKTVNLTEQAKGFKEEASDFADKAFLSEQTTQALEHGTRNLYTEVKHIFCTTKPADQVCAAPRGKRETPPVTSGASRPTPLISQVINFFYPSVGQDEYKLKNKIQELDQVAKIIDVADVVTKFERVLEETASKCSIPKKSLNFNPVKLQSTIINKSLFNDGNRNELLKFLCVAAKKSFSHYKQIDKCLATLKDHMEKTLKTNEQQRDSVNTEKIVADSEQPRSFMSYIAPPSSLSTINQTAVGYLR